jgi:hypothetical protein
LAVYRVGLLYLSGLRHGNHIQEGRAGGKVNEREWLWGELLSGLLIPTLPCLFFVPDVMPDARCSASSVKAQKQQRNIGAVRLTNL